MTGKEDITIKLSSIRIFIRDSFQNIKRNSVMSVASVASVIAALIIIGVFLVLAININYMTTEVEKNLEVKVYLNEDISEATKGDIKATLLENKNVKEAIYESQEEALNNFKDSFGDKSYLLSGYEGKNNPLPDSYIIKVRDSSKINEIYSYAKGIVGVKDVVYGEDVVDNLIKFNNIASGVSIVIFIILSIVSIFIIFNTIKLTVYARRNDITVMKYIGATDWFIRVPFLIEGSLLGLGGAASAMLIIRNAYYYIIGALQGGITSVSVANSLAPAGVVMNRITIFFLIYGIAIGAIGSGFSIRKFLNV